MAAPKSILSIVPAQQNPQLPKHFFAALDAGWSVVPGSLEVHCFQNKWTGQLLLSKGSARASVSFIAFDGNAYRFNEPRWA